VIGRKSTLAMVNVVLGSALGIVALFLAGRFFGDEAIGEMTLAFSILGILFFVTDLGMGQAHVKRVSEGRHAGDCFATYTVFKVAATGVFLLLVGASIALYTLVLGRTIEDTTPAAIVFALVYYVAKALQDIAQSSFEARVETAKAQLSIFLDTIVRVGVTAVFAGIIAATVSGIGPLAGRIDPDAPLVQWARENRGSALSLATTLGGITAAGAALLMLMRAREKGRFRLELLRDYWTFALPLFITSTAGIVATHIDGAALGVFLGKADAGVWGAIRRIPLVLLGVGTAVAIVLFPSISAMGARGERREIQDAMDKALRYLSMLLVPIVTFVVLFAEPVIRIAIGADFVTGANALRIMCIYVLVATFAYAHGTLLMGLGKPGAAARMGLLYSVLVVVLDLVLIPYDIQSLGIRLAGLGLLGAAVGTLTAGVVWYAGLRYASYRKVGYRERAHVVRHVLGAAAMSAALLGLDRIVPFERWFHAPLFALLGVTVYALALFALRELRREDVRLILDNVHPGEMVRYVRTELFHRRR